MPHLKRSMKISFFVLYMGAFLDWISYGLIYPTFAAAMFHHDPEIFSFSSDTWRSVGLGILVAASPLAQFLSAPVTGSLSDSMGRKPVLQIAALFIMTGYLLSGFGMWKDLFSLAVLGRVITGIGASNISVINSSVSDFSTQETKTKNFGLIAMANGVGFSIGPFLGGKLSTLGFSIPYFFAGLLTLVTFFFYTFIFYETHSPKKDKSIYSAFHLREIFKMSLFHEYRSLFLAFFIFCFGWSFYWEFVPVTWIKLYGFNVSKIGNFYGYASAFYVLSSGLLIRPLVKKFKPLAILLVSWGALSIFILSLFHAPVWLYWVYIPIQQFFVALIFPVGTAFVSDRAAGYQGEILGIFQALQSFAFAATPFLGGILLTFSYDTPIVIGGLAMALCCLVIFTGYKKEFRHVLNK